MSSLKKEVTSNLFWRFMERCGAQGVTLVVSVILARLLDPEVYGTVALVTVITTLLQDFIDSGLGNALIQKKDADDLDFSSVFWFNMGMCVILYVLMFFAAPFIASFYGIRELTSIVRVLSLTLILSGVKNIQQAYVSRNLIFKKFFFATLGGTVFAAVVGIWMAYKGFGVWALVAQYLANNTIDTLILWLTVDWRPQKAFSFSRLKSLFSYGWKLLASGLLGTLCDNLHQLIIGKMYSSEDLAFYNQGNKFPHLLVSNINSSIDSVLLPTMSKEQNDVEAVRNMTRRSIKVSTFIMAPMMIGLAFIAEPTVKLILTDKWLPCVPFLQIFCIKFLVYPIHTANLNAIKAMGRSDIFLKLEIIKRAISLMVLLITMWYGPLVMALSTLLTSVIGQIINAWPNRKLLDYSLIDQWKDILPAVSLSVIMGVAVYFLGEAVDLPVAAELMLQIAAGAIIYISGSALLRLDSFDYCLSIIKGFTKK